LLAANLDAAEAPDQIAADTWLIRLSPSTFDSELARLREK
jgi:hypothetical protein